MTKEADVKEAVKKVLRSYGSKVWWFMPVPSGFGTQGVPDFICCANGVFVSIETKFGKNGLTDWQIKQVDAITTANGLHLTINDSNVNTLKPVLDAVMLLKDEER